MKPIVLFVLLIVLKMNSFSQDNSSLKFIFVPHPRSEDKVNESVLPGIASIDFAKYDVTMLGGDITYSTSKNSATLSYCDRLFDLKNPNTLWGLGNHDVESGNRDLISEFTGRDSYYSYYRDKVTFLVLDAELDAEGFKRTFIKGDQLQLVKNVCDTISDSNFLILLHSRFIWMINNEYFTAKLADSIAASSRSMDTTNFYSEIYPLLQKVKARGIQVKVFGGDKSKMNIAYSPEDSITFYAAIMAPEFADSVNSVIVVNYDVLSKKIDCEFVTLAKINEGNQVGVIANSDLGEQATLTVWPTSFSKQISIQFSAHNTENVTLKIYSVNGQLCQSIKCKSNEEQFVNLNRSGVYFAKVFYNNSVQVKKFVVQ